jgi:hypothetical protein
LVNVINIMPVPAERDYVLTLCNQRLADGGRLLWYTQRGDEHYQGRLRDRFRLGDGVYVGRFTYHKTFYREYEAKEIDALVRRAGFDYDRTIGATWRNQSRLYKKTGPAVLAAVLRPESIDHALVTDDSIPDPKIVKAKKPGRARSKFEPNEVTTAGEKRKGKANPEQLSPQAQWIEALQQHPEGDHGRSYSSLIQKLFEHLFADALHKFEFLKLPGDSAFEDLRAENKSKSGFFAALRSDHDLVSLRIIVRCRNRRYAANDPAFDRLTDGMDRHLGFGLLTYRGGSQSNVIERCRRYFLVSDTPTAILPLDDNNLAALLRSTGETAHTRVGQRGNVIDDFLSKRFCQVTAPAKVFLSYSRDDENLMKEVNKALSTLKNRRAIDLWVDQSKNQSGDHWKKNIEQAVSEAEIAIFLISNNSLSSDFINRQEVDPLIKAQDTRSVKIIPVLLSPARLPTKLAKLQFINNRKPVRGLPIAKRDAIWLKVVERIESAFPSLR